MAINYKVVHLAEEVLVLPRSEQAYREVETVNGSEVYFLLVATVTIIDHISAVGEEVARFDDISAKNLDAHEPLIFG